MTCIWKLSRLLYEAAALKDVLGDVLGVEVVLVDDEAVDAVPLLLLLLSFLYLSDDEKYSEAFRFFLGILSLELSEELSLSDSSQLLYRTFLLEAIEAVPRLHTLLELDLGGALLSFMDNKDS